MIKATETQGKAIAGAISAFFISIVPILLSFAGGPEVTDGQVSEAKSALEMLITVGGSTLVGWLFVYFAPKNKPLDDG